LLRLSPLLLPNPVQDPASSRNNKFTKEHRRRPCFPPSLVLSLHGEIPSGFSCPA
jgi:hypothetical protein